MLLKKLKTQKLILLALLALSMLTPTRSLAMMRAVFGRLGLKKTSLHAQAPRLPLTRAFASKAKEVPNDQMLVQKLGAVVKKLKATEPILADLDARQAVAHLAASKAGAHPHYTPTLVQSHTRPKIALLEKWAKKLDRQADDIEKQRPLRDLTLQLYHNTQLMAAALRSESAQLKQPGSAITERKLQDATPAALEALALSLEDDKKALEKRSQNPDTISLADAEKRAQLIMQIPAIRNQALLLRKQILALFSEQE